MPRDSLNDGDARARVTQLPEDAGAARQNFTSPAHALARGVRARARKKRPLELKARARDAQRLLEASVRAAVIESARGVFYIFPPVIFRVSLCLRSGNLFFLLQSRRLN